LIKYTVTLIVRDITMQYAVTNFTNDYNTKSFTE